jgi:tetratricopeptide (TPR) repeat protein
MVERRIAASPNDDYVWVNAGWRYLNAGRLDDALRAASMVYNHPDVASLLGEIKLAQGELAEAVSIFEDDLDRQGRGQIQLGNLAYAYFKADQPSKAQPLLDELEAQADTRFVTLLPLAAVYFAAGDEARSYELLESAVQARERGVIFLGGSRIFAGQRDDPRFIAILEQVGLVRSELSTEN